MAISALKTAFDAPDEVFGHPQRLVVSTVLSHDEKVALLRKWKSELEKLRWPNAAPTPSQRVNAVDTRRLAVVGKLAAVHDALMEMRRQ